MRFEEVPSVHNPIGKLTDMPQSAATNKTAAFPSG
jgi:hypothetical protein